MGTVSAVSTKGNAMIIDETMKQRSIRHKHNFIECIIPNCNVRKSANYRHQHCNQNCIAIRRIVMPYKEN